MSPPPPFETKTNAKKDINKTTNVKGIIYIIHTKLRNCYTTVVKLWSVLSSRVFAINKFTSLEIQDQGASVQKTVWTV